MSLSLTYGEHLETESSHETIKRVNEFLVTSTNAAAPSAAFLVEFFPALNNLPEWVATWKRTFGKLEVKFTSMWEELLEGVRVKMVCRPRPLS